MGRQISFHATPEDERELVAFLRSTATIALFESRAPSKEALLVFELNSTARGHHDYSIWNRAFPWEPSYMRDVHGEFYVSNVHTGPILELSRSVPSAGRTGRLYWARHRSAPAGLLYDADAFSRWIDRIFRWVRRQGERAPGGTSYDPYVLPEARRCFPNLLEPAEHIRGRPRIVRE